MSVRQKRKIAKRRLGIFLQQKGRKFYKTKRHRTQIVIGK